MNNARVKNITYYFRHMLKFYELKAQGVPQVFFVLLLAVAFGFRLLAQPMAMDLSIYQQQLMVAYDEVLTSGSMTDPSVMNELMRIPFSQEFVQFITVMLKLLGLIFLQQIFLMLLSFFYLGAWMVDLETPKPSVGLYFKKTLKALPRYIGFNALYFLALGLLMGMLLMFSSFLMMIIPIPAFALFLVYAVWFLAQVIFVFKDITLLDTRVGVLKNFTLSWKLTAGNRLIIGWNIFFIEFLTLLVSMVSVGTHVRLTLFVVSFLEVIVLLFRQRLVGQMYVSRTRIIRGENGED